MIGIQATDIDMVKPRPNYKDLDVVCIYNARVHTIKLERGKLPLTITKLGYLSRK
jgi:hypothetical protein